MSHYQETRCQLQNVVVDAGAEFRPRLTTRLRQIARRMPLLLTAKRLLSGTRVALKRSSRRRGGPRVLRPPVVREALDLAPGEWVRVRSATDVKLTLNEDGCHGRTRFLAGMWKFCGRRLRVFKRVEQVVDYRTGRMWRIHNTVLLSGAFCERDPSEYYRCDQTCFYYWKEAWLERCETDTDAQQSPIES